MLYPWHRLPDPVRAALLQASSGRVHLLNTATACLEAAQRLPAASGDDPTRPLLLSLGAGLLQATFEEQPFERQCAQRTREMDQAFPFLDGRVRILVNRVLKATLPPDAPLCARMERLTREGNIDALCALTNQQCLEDMGNLFWVGFARYLALREGRYDWLSELLPPLQATLPASLYAALQAENAFILDDLHAAAELFGQAHATAPCDLWLERRAEALVRLGQDDEALSLWNAVLERRPWHVSLWQRRHSLIHGLHRPGNLPDGPGVILLYTWNGGRKIDLTLEALAASTLPAFTGTAQILLADNGSDDGQTPQILASWAEKLGSRLRLITLPCNIGAPAARNWLLAQSETRAADWIVYLDDDLLVPQDWLGHFGTAMAAAPEHTVYGCQIMRHNSPLLIQSVDMHQLPPATSQGPAWLPESPVHLQASYHGEGQPDYGQFAYTRPCLHVSGCCHLFRRRGMDAVGGFDLRFSPTQVDDFEHDVRLAMKNDMACYHGHLRVQHMQATGTSTTRNLPKIMNAHANHLKLQALYPSAEAEALRARCTAVLLQDTIRKQH